MSTSTTYLDPFQSSAEYVFFDHPEILLHAVSMFVLFGVVLPGAAVFARYYRDSTPVWMSIHAGIQTLACILILFATIPVFTNAKRCTKIHRFFGYVLISLVSLQLIFGILLYQSFMSIHSSSSIPLYRYGRFHGILGGIIILIGFTNIPQGIAHDYQFNQRPWVSWYLIYYAVLLFWATVIIIKEINKWNTPFNRTSTPLITESHSDTLLINHGPLVSNQPIGLKKSKSDSLAEQTAMDAITMAISANLRKLSWLEFDHYVMNEGKQWVIGPGGVIFDISRWITAHPGGPQVLWDVMGCNIVTDYFNVEIFDCDKFRAFTTRPSQLPAAINNNNNINGDRVSLNSSINTYHPTFGTDPSLTLSTALSIAVSRVTQPEWDNVLASRRTHIHSRTAIAKLATMAVAWIPEAGKQFYKYEWRRYALTQKLLLSPLPSSDITNHTNTNNNNNTVSVYLFTFTLLYPHESYPEEPCFFLPGHSVELRMRLPKSHPSYIHNGEYYVRRFYTPLTGNMSHFTLSIKIKPNGIMSRLLLNLQVAQHKQIQFRGPIGSPLMNPDRPLPVGNGCYDHTLFFTAGTGVTPTLQTLGFYFTQTYFGQIVHIPYPGLGANELKANSGDKILIKYPLANGWVWATNLNTYTDGYFPLQCLIPWVGRNVKVSVVVADHNIDEVIGHDLLCLVEDAYPRQVQVHYRLSYNNNNNNNTYSSINYSSLTRNNPKLTIGKVDREYIMNILHITGFMTQLQPYLHNLNHGYSRSSSSPSSPSPVPQLKIGICGPQSYLDSVYMTLTELIPDDLIWLLPSSSPLTIPGHNGMTSLISDNNNIPTTSSSSSSQGNIMKFDSARNSSMSMSTLLPSSLDNKHQLNNNNNNNNNNMGPMTKSDIFYQTLYLPGLPVHKDSVSGDSDWFYLPPSTTLTGPIHQGSSPQNNNNNNNRNITKSPPSYIQHHQININNDHISMQTLHNTNQNK